MGTSKSQVVKLTVIAAMPDTPLSPEAGFYDFLGNHPLIGGFTHTPANGFWRNDNGAVFDEPAGKFEMYLSPDKLKEVITDVINYFEENTLEEYIIFELQSQDKWCVHFQMLQLKMLGDDFPRIDKELMISLLEYHPELIDTTAPVAGNA